MKTLGNAASFSSTHRFHFTIRGMLAMVFLACVTFATCGGLFRAVREARRAAMRSSTEGQLCQLALALHNYHDTHGTFPPAYLTDANGRPMHSWRVLILPYLEHQALYNAYNFNEPWDGPSNARLLHQMPRVFRALDAPESDSRTTVAVIVGAGTAFPGARSTRLSDFVGATDETILIAETATSDIPWLAPRDLETSTMSFQVNDRRRPSISTVPWRSPFAVFVDAQRQMLDPSLSPDAVRALTTIAREKSGIREKGGLVQEPAGK